MLVASALFSLLVRRGNGLLRCRRPYWGRPVADAALVRQFGRLDDGTLGHPRDAIAGVGRRDRDVAEPLLVAPAVEDATAAEREDEDKDAHHDDDDDDDVLPLVGGLRLCLRGRGVR